MASLVAKAIRNRDARDSLDVVLAQVAQRLHLMIPPPPMGRVADLDLVPILEIERFRDILVLIEARLAALEAEQAQANDRATWSLATLRHYAEQHDIALPPEVRKKEDVLAVIAAAEATPLVPANEDSHDAG